MDKIVYFEESKLKTTDCAQDVLPVPTGPVIRTGWPASKSAPTMHS